MDEIMRYGDINTVEELTDKIGSELTKAAISFVRIGYLLKKARDENILKDSGYPDIYVYANTKFGLDKSQVSRFIRINDRFSKGGYSEQLELKYEDFGYSKLSIMLTLPDEINEELSPEYSKSEINAIKTEYEAEQKISDLEVMMEEKPEGPDDFFAQIVKELNDEHPESAQYLNTTMKLAEHMNIEATEQDIQEAYIPEGTAAYSIRIPGKGRYMVTMKEQEITIISLRDTTDKSSMTWTQFKDLLMADMQVRDFPEEEKKPAKKKPEKVKPAKPKENRYVEEVRKYHEQEEVAPVQPEKKVEETAKTQNEETPERIPEEDTEIIPAGQGMDNVPQNVREVEDKVQEDVPTTGNESVEATKAEKSKAAAGDTVGETDTTSETYTAAGGVLTSAQKDMLEWLDLLKRKTLPEDGSRPDWQSIYDEVRTMEKFVKQFTY